MFNAVKLEDQTEHGQCKTLSPNMIEWTVTKTVTEEIDQAVAAFEKMNVSSGIVAKFKKKEKKKKKKKQF